ncbi:PREDICTED: uncharacterized protein LOC104774499 [Camelina sativa]|uniref:Uncharacterized protein LOC104774499 n=1 Tax=Camelina sativa TaxID=90675 RepID=A0ABM0Y8Z9_CAMSA|nr:PREDICTED: uncharacterized protein LOC104774499 [Camelina sativa]
MFSINTLQKRNLQSNAVQAYIPANRLFRYEGRLKSNSVYTLNNFMIISTQKVYKVPDHKHGIVFTEKTSMVLEPIGDHKIDEQKFRFRNYEDFASIIDTNADLFDVIGQVRLIVGDNIHSPSTLESALQVEGSRSSDRVFLHFQLKDGQTIRIYLWGTIAVLFRERWNESEVKPAVLLITTVNPKTVGRMLSLFQST